MKLLTPLQVARELGVSPATVTRLIKRGALESVNFSGTKLRPRRRITPDQLKKFKEGNPR